MITKEDLESLIWTVGTLCESDTKRRLKNLIFEYVNLLDIVNEINRLSTIVGGEYKTLYVEGKFQTSRGADYHHAKSDYDLVPRIERVSKTLDLLEPTNAKFEWIEKGVK